MMPLLDARIHGLLPMPLWIPTPQNRRFVRGLKILEDAVYAMKDGGTLSVRTAVADGTVVVEFADTGVGIPLDHLDRIFDPFFTTKPAVSGTGLGLSVSLGIVQSHGGTIEVQSQAGSGAIFTIKLPARGPAPV